MDVTVPTPDSDPPPLDLRDDGGCRSKGGGEYGDHDNVDARNRCHRGSLGGRIGRAKMATALQRRTTTMMRKQENMWAIFGGCATPTLRGAFREDNTDNNDDEDK